MRQIYVVSAHIVDANGAFHVLDGYPKTFDSKNYGDDIDKTRRRASGDMSEVWGAMCKRDDRIMQVVSLSTCDGFIIETKSEGVFPENLEPEE